LGKPQTTNRSIVAYGWSDLAKKEEMIYLAFIRLLDAEISKYAKANSLKLVLRQYETSFEDGQSLPDVAKSLNRTILHEEGLDITDVILKALRTPTSGGDR